MIRPYLVLLATFLPTVVLAAEAAPGVQITMGKTGLASLKYGDLELLQNGDFRVNWVGFRGWDAEGAPADLKDGKLTVDAAAQQVTRSYSWGAVSCTYATQADTLTLTISITNNAELPLGAIHLQLMEVKFPACPKGFDGHPRLSPNMGGPTAITADYGAGVMSLRNEDVGRPLMLGYPWSIGDRKANTTYPIWAYTHRHGMLPTSLPTIDRPVYPGGSDRWVISMRFGPEGTKGLDLNADLYARYREAYPPKLNWPDRRPIASMFLCASATKYPTNPRGWFNDKKVDVTTPEGMAAFKDRMLKWADTSVPILKDMDAQGMILWDPEGQEFPHAISYLGDPRSLPPEADAVMDEFYKRFTDAGLRVGCCVRPQRPLRRAYQEGVFQVQVADQATNLIAKIDAAKKRWGCTLFYVDSNSGPGDPNEALIFKQVAAAHPDVLLIPEHETVRFFAYTAPYNELRMGVAGTPATARAVYSNAFSVIHVSDGDVDGRRADLVANVKAGDILMCRGWFKDPAIEKVKAIYRDAK